MPHARPLLLVVALAGSLLSFSGAGSPAGAVTAGSPYIAVTPTRILDTRAGTGAAKAAVAPNGRVVLTVAGGQIPSGVTTVVLNVTVTQPTAGTGYVTVWADQAPRPAASNINFVRGQTVPNLVVAPVSAGGKVDLVNGSTGTVQLVADVSGYFAPGSTSVDQGMFGSISPTRVLDTRSGGAVGAGKVVNATVTGQGVPADASAVVVNLTVTQPTAATGDATAYPAGGSRPTASNVNFVRGQTVANLAVVPVGAGGEISLYNHSGGTVQFIADVSGYFLGGAPVDAGGFGALAPARLLDTRRLGGPVAAGATETVSVSGRAGIPLGNVRAVVLNVTVAQPTRAGVVTVYAGATRPAVSNLNFGAGQTVPNLVVAPVGTDGKVQLYNGSIGSMQLIADVSGYVLNQDAPLPDPASKSHYVRNLTGDPTTDAAKMSTAGCSDAQAGATFVLLHIGAQSITAPLSAQNPGVALSSTSPVVRLTYAQLRAAIDGYTSGYTGCGSADVTVAIGTNNDGDFSTYTAAEKGAGWATEVMNKLTARAHVTLVGANDIEAGFASSLGDAQGWESAYLDNTSANLIFTGSADGCPTTYGATGQTCQPIRDQNGVLKTWTQAQYYALAGGNDPRIQALPQIYFDTQAVQWANIDAAGGRNIHFAGALTEHNAVCGPDCAMTPQQGWAALYHALSTIMAPSLPAVTDLDILS